jgi:hypothetical protein
MLEFANTREQGKKECSDMARQIVMDATGDTHHAFDPTDAEALRKAEERPSFDWRGFHGCTAAN